jgi:AcrR family transcriptional regulator
MTGDAREELLSRIVADVAHHGVGDRSLRDLAAAIGSSHRMLLYHFGSRARLVEAVVENVEARQRTLMSSHQRLDATATWDRVSSAASRPFVLLFFEALALRGRSGRTVELTQPWIDDVMAAAAATGHTVDPLLARLAVAVVRGLLIDVVAGGDPQQARAALQRFEQLASAAT